ncbi:hypothetical protein Q9L58_004030 [Maublancomyces gigas]|uniref:Protein kinase domain-containing protein n=1 Tax=Discina gigas TaxID=1032678 RepID=A0ABR3GLY0_9PEZI
MSIPPVNFDHYKLETSFHDGYVVSPTYEWKYSQRRTHSYKTGRRQRRLGSSASCNVWLEREDTGQLRAIKILHQDLLPNSQELLTLITLAMEFLGWYENEYNTFFVLEYVKYELGVLHGQGICHRDIKPKNILVPSIDPIWVKIADFGMSKQAKNTALRTRIGTTNYVSPKLLALLPGVPRSEFTHAIDIYKSTWWTTLQSEFTELQASLVPAEGKKSILMRQMREATVDIVPFLSTIASSDLPSILHDALDKRLYHAAMMLLKSPSPELIASKARLLYKAVQAGRVDTAKMLLANNTNVNSPIDRATPIEAAVNCQNIEMLELLLVHMPDINAPVCLGGISVLVMASGSGYLDVVRLLLYRVADTHCTAMDRQTALQAARKCGHTEIVDLLVMGDGHKIAGTHKHGSTAAAKSGDAVTGNLRLDIESKARDEGNSAQTKHIAGPNTLKDDLKALDQELCSIIAVTTTKFAAMTPEERTWDNVLGALEQNPVLKPMEDETIHKTDKHSLNSFTLLGGNGKPNKIAMDAVGAWFRGFITDEDVLRTTKIDTEWCKYTVCQTGAAIQNIVKVVAKSQKINQELVDIGVLTYPTKESPHFKVFRIQLKVWAETKRFLNFQTDNNGVIGEFSYRKYETCSTVIDWLSGNIISHDTKLMLEILQRSAGMRD